MHFWESYICHLINICVLQIFPKPSSCEHVLYCNFLLGSFKVTSLRNSFSTTTSLHQKEYPNWSPRRETWDFLTVSSVLDFRNRHKENATQFLREARSGLGYWETYILIRTRETTFGVHPFRASALGLVCTPHGECQGREPLITSVVSAGVKCPVLCLGYSLGSSSPLKN